ncbi:MAG: F0F1 ATP synthase subunit gamma [Deltaproteobacteria bacterium]|nr:F0F1 ATP synthase subunit gamma [Deltaproteobacteria bacterium]
MAQTTESLGRRLHTTREIGAVVRTMKALAAVNIRQFERASQALEDYRRTVELGLGAALLARPGYLAQTRAAQPGGPVAAVVLGTDQGMCGSLNEQVAELAMASLRDLEPREASRTVLAVGERLAGRLEDREQAVHAKRDVPGSVSGLTPAVQQVLVLLDHWRQAGQAERVFVYHARPVPGAAFEAVGRQLLPIDRAWLSRFALEPWPTNQLPLVAGDWRGTFAALLRQMLLVSLFGAFADSLAAENASRLAAMQGAERNVEERLAELTQAYNQARQQSITEELLDIAAGFEALAGGP